MINAPDETSKSSSIIRFLLACAVFAVATLIVFGDVLFRSDTIVSLAGTDIWRQFYGWREFGFGELSQGHLALWNPYIFCGAPYLGGFQSALLYPPNWLYLLLPLTAAINVGVALHVFLSGVFMYCWAAYRRLHWLACVVAGLIFMFGGPQMAQLQAGHLPNACTLIWAPLIFLAIDDLALTASPQAIFLGMAAVALQVLAGHPQYVFFTAVAAGIYLLLNLFITPHRLKLIGGFLICYVGGALLAAVQLFTGLAATTEAMRTKLSFDFVSTFSFPPENLLTTILPAGLGDGVHAAYWGRWFYWEMSAFVGVTAIILALFSVAVPSRQRRFAFTMLCLLFLLALGKYTWLGEVVFRLPGFSSFRGISKFMFLVLMFLAMLSGLGFDLLLRGGQVRRWFMDYLAGAAILLVIAAITIMVSANSDWTGWWGQIIHSVNWTYKSITKDEKLLQETAAAAATDLWWAAGACVAVFGLLLAGRKFPRANWAIAAVLAVELIRFAMGVHSSFSVAAMQKESEGEVGFVKNGFSGDYPADMRVWTYDQGNFLLAHRLNSWGDDPMMLRRYVELVAATFNMPPELMLTTIPPPRNVLASLNLPAWRLSRSGGLLVADQNGTHLLPINFLLLRASLVGTVQVEPDRQKELKELTSADFDPKDSAIVESPIIPAPAGGYDLGQVEVKDIDSDTLEIDATTQAPCLLLITDAYSTGWRIEPMADSSQSKYDIIPADLAFRGVPLTTPGHHHFRMVYLPTAFVVGKWTTLSAMAVYLALLMFWLGWRHVFIVEPQAGAADQQPAITHPTQT